LYGGYRGYRHRNVPPEAEARYYDAPEYNAEYDYNYQYDSGRNNHYATYEGQHYAPDSNEDRDDEGRYWYPPTNATGRRRRPPQRPYQYDGYDYDYKYKYE
jgi:hypothetical protein